MAPITVFAPAKINLFLHVVGRRADGYHLLESLVAFASIGDMLTVRSAPDFKLEVVGPFAKDLSSAASNSISDAAHFLAKENQRPLHAHIQLIKNLPVASGIGGGSSDAAATLLACRQLWNISSLPSTTEIAAKLGADVPVCLRRRPTFMSGIGEILSDVTVLPACDIVLVTPGIALPTAAVFRALTQPYSDPGQKVSGHIRGLSDLTQFIGSTRNDLESPALSLASVIAASLEALKAQPDCMATRMSGSGATCFGLFSSKAAAQQAAATISKNQPDWWVKSGQLYSGPLGLTP